MFSALAFDEEGCASKSASDHSIGVRMGITLVGKMSTQNVVQGCNLTCGTSDPTFLLKR